MRAFGLRGSAAVGASYKTRKIRNVLNHEMTWMSPDSLDDLADDPSIVDSVHPFFFRDNKCVRASERVSCVSRRARAVRAGVALFVLASRAVFGRASRFLRGEGTQTHPTGL